MMSVTIPRIAAAGAVIAAILLVQLTRAPTNESSSLPFEVSPLPAREQPAALAVAPAAARSEPLAAAKQRELEAMSETFRNTTFLIAIRDSGFVCDQLLRVVGGLDDSPKWLASCSAMLAYTVGVASDGTLRVAPMLQYLDGIAPGAPPLERNNELVLPQQLPPQSVPPPR
jgi:hypothetical protein